MTLCAKWHWPITKNCWRFWVMFGHASKYVKWCNMDPSLHIGIKTVVICVGSSRISYTFLHILRILQIMFQNPLTLVETKFRRHWLQTCLNAIFTPNTSIGKTNWNKNLKKVNAYRIKESNIWSKSEWDHSRIELEVKRFSYTNRHYRYMIKNVREVDRKVIVAALLMLEIWYRGYQEPLPFGKIWL